MKFPNVKVSSTLLNQLFHVHNIDKARAKDYTLRFGQRFVNEVLRKEVSDSVFPELYYQKDDRLAYNMVLNNFTISYVD